MITKKQQILSYLEAHKNPDEVNSKEISEQFDVRMDTAKKYMNKFFENRSNDIFSMDN